MIDLEVIFFSNETNPKCYEIIFIFQAVLEQLEHDLLEVNSNKDALKKNYLELQELRHILTKATTFFEEV